MPPRLEVRRHAQARAPRGAAGLVSPRRCGGSGSRGFRLFGKRPPCPTAPRQVCGLYRAGRRAVQALCQPSDRLEALFVHRRVLARAATAGSSRDPARGCCAAAARLAGVRIARRSRPRGREPLAGAELSSSARACSGSARSCFAAVQRARRFSGARARASVAFSSGNHAQAIALARSCSDPCGDRDAGGRAGQLAATSGYGAGRTYIGFARIAMRSARLASVAG